MLECSLILNNATERSLVILDEIGRGTSTYDGLALAVAIIDYLVSRIRCRTLFATHYHELIALEKQLKGIKNYHMSVYEWENELVFLFKVQEGAIDRSFGIYVAKMAGIPPVIIKNAKSLLSKIERKTQQEFSNVLANFKTSQLVLFSGNFEKVICELKKINYNTLTPVEALMKLKELKEILDEKSV
jgi:DNA mismatch repair protein MutS